jgi:hypothetical protein
MKKLLTVVLMIYLLFLLVSFSSDYIRIFAPINFKNISQLDMQSITKEKYKNVINSKEIESIIKVVNALRFKDITNLANPKASYYLDPSVKIPYCFTIFEKAKSNKSISINIINDQEVYFSGRLYKVNVKIKSIIEKIYNNLKCKELEIIPVVKFSPIKIVSIDDLNIKIYQNSKYKLPKTVFAFMNDKSIKSLKVIWNISAINNSTLGTNTYYGTVEGYNRQVKLTVNVVETEEGKREKAISDILNVTENDVTQVSFCGKLGGESGNRVISDIGEIKSIVKWINNMSIIGDAKLPPDMMAPLSGIQISLVNGKTIDLFIWDGYLIVNEEFQAYQKDLIGLFDQN